MKSFLAKVWKKLHLSKNFQLKIMGLVQDKFLVGVTGIIFNDKNEVLLLKHTYRGNSWSLPGGYLKGKEHPREGLEREIKEETDLTVSADRRLKIRTDRETARLDISYSGAFIGGEFKPSHEVSDAKFFSFNDLPLITKDQLLFIELALKKRTKK
jgi:8-oxo-dGTP diphosphatase